LAERVVKIPQLQRLLRYICETDLNITWRRFFDSGGCGARSGDTVFRLDVHWHKHERARAGVDFGTLSVRVSLVDSERGPIGAGTASIHCIEKRRPDFATQRHADHMDALVLAMRKALATAGVKVSRLRQLLGPTGSSVVPVGKRARAAGRLYLCAITGRGAKRHRLRKWRAPRREGD